MNGVGTACAWNGGVLVLRGGVMAGDGVQARGKERDAVQGNGAAEDRPQPDGQDADTQETREWLDSLDGVLYLSGRERARYLIDRLAQRAEQRGVSLPVLANTPYINTIPPDEQPDFPGDRELERKIKSLVRWNALAMVVHANEQDKTIGG